MRRPSVLSFLVPALVAPLLGAAPEPAAARGILEVVPSRAFVVVFFRDPILTQAKMQGVMQRLGVQEKDPLTELQEAYGLRQLPTDRRGMALAILPDEGHPGKEAELLFLPAPDLKALAETLKAKPTKDGKVYEFKGKDGAALLGGRDGWAVLAKGEDRRALQAALADRQGLRREAGDLEAWLQEGDLTGIVTAHGIGDLAFSARKRLPSGPQVPGGTNPMEELMAHLEREVSRFGFRIDADENGNLKGSARLVLAPAGTWSSLGSGLREADRWGIGGLPKSAFALAMGGSLPKAWMQAWLETVNEASLRGVPGLDPKDLEAVRQAQRTVADRVTGLAGGVMSPEIPLLTRVQVDSAAGYQADTAALVATMNAALRKQAPEGAVVMEPVQAAGRSGFAVHPRTPEGAPAAPGFSFLQVDGQNLLAAPGSLETLAEWARRNEAEGLDQDSDLRAAARFLPRDAHFYAFVSPRMVQAMPNPEDRAKAALDDDLQAKYPDGPVMATNIPGALALRFEPGVWELSMAFPMETQAAIGGYLRQLAALAPVRKALREEQEKRDAARPQPELPAEDEAPDEE